MYNLSTKIQTRNVSFGCVQFGYCLNTLQLIYRSIVEQACSFSVMQYQYRYPEGNSEFRS